MSSSRFTHWLLWPTVEKDTPVFSSVQWGIITDIMDVLTFSFTSSWSGLGNLAKLLARLPPDWPLRFLTPVCCSNCAALQDLSSDVSEGVVLLTNRNDTQCYKNDTDILNMKENSLMQPIQSTVCGPCYRLRNIFSLGNMLSFQYVLHLREV